MGIGLPPMAVSPPALSGRIKMGTSFRFGLGLIGEQRIDSHLHVQPDAL